MIQVNLIPDLKAEFLKAQRNKRLVMSLSFLIAAGFIALVVVLFIYVNVVQKQHSDNLTENINELIADYQRNEDLGKIVTVQKQLSTLPGLHDDKPLITRLPQVLTAITPPDDKKTADVEEGVKLRAIDMSFDSNQGIFSGNADSVIEATRFINSVKNAKVIYTDEDGNEVEIKAFSNVISDISPDEEETSFEVIFDFDPDIFLLREDVSIFVPEINSAPSALDAPNIEDVFESSEDEE